MKRALGICILAYLHIFTFAYSSEGATVVVDNRLTSLEVAGVTELTGAGGVILSSLSIPTDARLVLDPIATPVKVSATPTFGDGAKIALSSDYADMTLGRVVLMTYTGAATIPAGLFDASSVSGSATLSQQTASDGTSKQLVLTVGDYENEAKEIRILPIGDSITHGYVKSINGYSQQAQYRTAIAARLAANGYKPVMLGHLKIDMSGTAKTCDAAGVQQPDGWIWHSGVSADRIVSSTTSGTSAGVRDNLHLYLDVAGKPDVITLLIGTNDMGAGREAADTFVVYTNLVWDIARQRPDAKIVASTVLERTDKATASARVPVFNRLLLDNLANMPANYAVTNLYPVVPQSVSGNYFDKLHPTMKGCAPISKGFAAKILEVLPRTSYSGPIDDTLTDEPQTALGAAATVPAAYRAGMVHVFTLDAPNAANGFRSAAPYTATNTAVALSRRLKKAGYYMELVRKGTNRRRYVWVDFNADGKPLDEMDFPWTGDMFHKVVTDLHVFSNDSGIHNIGADVSGCRGVIEATSGNYNAIDNQIPGVPPDLMSGGKYGWNDTLNTSGDYGCFQAHRIFSQIGDDTHWNDAEILFAWNRWGRNSDIDEIGIGTFANHAHDSNTVDYTFSSSAEAVCAKNGVAETVSAAAYQVRHLEIWAEPFALDEAKGEWIVESAATGDCTGAWLQGISYGEDGRAYLYNDVFTPYVVSTGNVMTVETKAQFSEDIEDRTPDAETQAAVKLSTNGCFQVWVGNPPAWVDVEAEGVTPVSGEEYILRVTFDYAARTYSVFGKTFPLAGSANCITSIGFVGDTLFTSLYGECRYEIIGFAEDEALVLSNNVEIVLGAAKAKWLNKCAGGDKAAVLSAAASLTAKEFSDAYLLNVDVAGDRSYTFAVTDIDVGDTSVTVAVTLTRPGKIEQKINGVLKFYGTSTLEAFKSGAAAPVSSQTLVNDDFSESDTTTATFQKGDNTFFNAKIEEDKNAEM